MTQEEFFNRYKYDRTKDRIGGGGFGNVYKVFDTIENETVALKIAEVKQGQESLSLLKEVELASSLKRHVNIARYTACYRFDLPNGHFDFGILQYYPLGNLSQLVKTKKLTHIEKEQIAKGVISGIQHLHNNNIVHRDLKSANILIAQGYQGEYVPKIADFGLSKQFAQNENSYFSNSFAGGSLLYVAPEQLEGKELRKNVDLWSLGVVLFELFVGDTPFRANVDDGSETARAEIIQKIRSASLPASITNILSPWQEIIRVCLVTNPSNRIKSIEEFQDIVNGKATTKKDSDRTEVETGPITNTKEKVNFENKGDRNESSKEKPISGWVLFLRISFALSFMVWWGLGGNLGWNGNGNSKISLPTNTVAKSIPNQEEEIWQDALSKDIESAYSRYLILYPDGKYATEAIKRVKGFNSKIANETVSDDLKSQSSRRPNISMVKIPGKDFKISKYEVTIGQYLAFCKATNSHWPKWLEKGSEFNIYTGTNKVYKEIGMKESNINIPITGVTYQDAIAFCEWIGGRLPTKLEWEYAAFGGQEYKYAGSNDYDEIAWYGNNSNGRCHEVGKLKPNGFGLYDMSGNVSEWTSNKWEYGDNNIYMGGSWGIFGKTECNKEGHPPYLKSDINIGFRLAR